MPGRRFEKIYSQGIGGGLTPLLDRDGQPLIWEGPQED